MNQLFHNLINNSLKFSRQDVQPQIHIDSRRMEGKACSSGGYCYEITIKDNGIGIEEEFSEKIFGIFNRLHTQSKFEGTGLGLALCKRIVEYHHGKIWVESNGEGSVFKIILPQKQNAEALVSS
jgi:signal transduction histidine kinase